MPPRDDDNDSTTLVTNQRSFLVTLSARALGSVGFGLSLLAIWLHWLMPSANAAFPEHVKSTSPHRHRRRSAPHVPHPTHKISLPVARSDSQDSSTPPKHVYFAVASVHHRKAPPTEEPEEVQSEPPRLTQDSVLHAQQVDESPKSLPPNLGSNPSPTNVLLKDTYDESIAESDSSQRSSLSSHIPRLMNHLVGKNRRRTSSPDSTTNSLTQSASLTDESNQRRPSIAFAAPWSASRNRRPAIIATNNASVDSAVPRSPFRRSSKPPPVTSNVGSSSLPDTPSSSKSFFLLKSSKSSRRASAPVPKPRTLPYEAPYFAEPPTPMDYLDFRKSPQFEDATTPTSVQSQASPGKENLIIRTSNPGSKQAIPRTRAPLGHGRPTLVRQRSVSESRVNGRTPTPP